MITVEDVSLQYKNTARPALSHVGFHVPKGEFAFLIGPSGSGKSTILRSLMRDVTVDSGRIEVAGHRVDKVPGRKVPTLRRQLGVVFQDYRLLPRMTVSENVAFALRVIGKGQKVIDKAVPETLDLVGLGGKGQRMPHELSGGEQQRVAIARAFVNRPRVLLADEPTGNLDQERSDEIVMLLQRINRTGTTILMATHDSRIVNALRTHVIEMSNGSVVRDDARGVYGGH